ncbi:hypothetical protein [Brevundimonas faecalis]|uniref:Type II secretory pathway pseudopilin PulG n=1 Tax=Brevundimonas faecalis TaxID=947378 RepID=A0ABV2R6C3_9CAUL
MSMRIASIAVMAVIAAGAATSASAQTFSPVGSFSVVTDYLYVEQSQQLSCKIDHIGGVVNAGGATATINANGNAFGANPDNLCTSVNLTKNWTLTPDTSVAGSNVRIDGLKVNSLLGSCGGSAGGTVYGYLDSTGYLTIPRQGFPGVIVFVPTTCYVEGGIQTVGPVTL